MFFTKIRLFIFNGNSPKDVFEHYLLLMIYQYCRYMKGTISLDLTCMATKSVSPSIKA